MTKKLQSQPVADFVRSRVADADGGQNSHEFRYAIPTSEILSGDFRDSRRFTALTER